MFKFLDLNVKFIKYVFSIIKFSHAQDLNVSNGNQVIGV